MLSLLLLSIITLRPLSAFFKSFMKYYFVTFYNSVIKISGIMDVKVYSDRVDTIRTIIRKLKTFKPGSFEWNNGIFVDSMISGIT